MIVISQYGTLSPITFSLNVASEKDIVLESVPYLDEKPPSHRTVCSGQWDRLNCGGRIDGITYRNNPQYLLYVSTIGSISAHTSSSGSSSSSTLNTPYSSSSPLSSSTTSTTTSTINSTHSTRGPAGRKSVRLWLDTNSSTNGTDSTAAHVNITVFRNNGQRVELATSRIQHVTSGDYRSGFCACEVDNVPVITTSNGGSVSQLPLTVVVSTDKRNQYARFNLWAEMSDDKDDDDIDIDSSKCDVNDRMRHGGAQVFLEPI